MSSTNVAEKKFQGRSESVESKVESKVKGKVESNMEGKVEYKVKGEMESKVERKMESKMGDKVESKVEGKMESKVEGKVEGKMESKIKGKVESKVEGKRKGKMESKVEREKETKMKTESKSKVKNKMERKMRSESEKKLWGMPELVEQLLLLLDPLSALRLLQTGIVEKQVFKESLSSKVWKQLIIKCSGAGTLQREDVKNLVQILKLMELEDSSAFLLPLLHLICEKCPPPDHQELWMGEVRGEVEISCPCQADKHKVSFDGFLLLENEVEGLFDTAVQAIKLVESRYNLGQPYLSALSSRISRQQNPVMVITVGRDLEIGKKKSAEAFSILLQAQEVKMTNLKVHGDIGEGGWEMVARAMQTRPSTISTVWTSKEGLEQGRKEDIKEIWEAVKHSFFISDLAINMTDDDFIWSVRVEKPKHTWRRLEEILDMGWGQFFCEHTEEKVERELEFEEDNNLVFSDSDDYSDFEEENTEDESGDEATTEDGGDGDEKETDEGDNKAEDGSEEDDNKGGAGNKEGDEGGAEEDKEQPDGADI